MPAESAPSTSGRSLAASQAGFSGRGASHAPPCRCAPARRMRGMPPLNAAASLEILQSQDIRDEARLRGARPPPPPCQHQPGLGFSRAAAFLRLARPVQLLPMRRPRICAAQNCRRARAATMRATCRFQRSSRADPAACRTHWTRCAPSSSGRVCEGPHSGNRRTRPCRLLCTSMSLTEAQPCRPCSTIDIADLSCLV